MPFWKPHIAQKHGDHPLLAAIEHFLRPGRKNRDDADLNDLRVSRGNFGFWKMIEYPWIAPGSGRQPFLLKKGSL